MSGYWRETARENMAAAGKVSEKHGDALLLMSNISLFYVFLRLALFFLHLWFCFPHFLISLHFTLALLPSLPISLRSSLSLISLTFNAVFLLLPSFILSFSFFPPSSFLLLPLPSLLPYFCSPFLLSPHSLLPPPPSLPLVPPLFFLISPYSLLPPFINALS